MTDFPGCNPDDTDKKRNARKVPVWGLGKMKTLKIRILVQILE